MQPTHQLRDGAKDDIIAWQYDAAAPIPVWVARNFHHISSAGLTHRSGHVVKPGEWICRSGDVAFVLTDEEFHKCFRPIPVKGTDGQGKQL